MSLANKAGVKITKQESHTDLYSLMNWKRLLQNAAVFQSKMKSWKHKISFQTDVQVPTYPVKHSVKKI